MAPARGYAIGRMPCDCKPFMLRMRYIRDSVRGIVYDAEKSSPAELTMEELNGRMIACQILITGLIARVANDQRDPLRFITDFRDEIRAVINGINIAGIENADAVRRTAMQTADEMFSLMKPPSAKDPEAS